MIIVDFKKGTSSACFKNVTKETKHAKEINKYIIIVEQETKPVQPSVFGSQ